MRRRHTEHTEEEHASHERWLLTYADLITLLLALFMMLYAMSVLDLRKYQAFQEAFTQGLGGHKTKANEIAPDKEPSATPSASPAPETPKSLDQEDLKKLKVRLEKMLKDAGLQDEDWCRAHTDGYDELQVDPTRPAFETGTLRSTGRQVFVKASWLLRF